MTGGTFDHAGGTVSAPTRLENVALRPHSASGLGTLQVVNTGNTLLTDISVNDTVIIDGGFAGFDGVLTAAASQVNNGTVRLGTFDNPTKRARLVFDCRQDAYEQRNDRDGRGTRQCSGSGDRREHSQ